MAVCTDCEQEMSTASTCSISRIAIGERTVVRLRLRRGRGEVPVPCHDCGVDPGGWHHLGCDAESCPLCRAQLISCNCGEPDDIDEDGEDDGAAFVRLRPVPRPVLVPASAKAPHDADETPAAPADDEEDGVQ